MVCLDVIFLGICSILVSLSFWCLLFLKIRKFSSNVFKNISSIFSLSFHLNIDCLLLTYRWWMSCYYFLFMFQYGYFLLSFFQWMELFLCAQLLRPSNTVFISDNILHLYHSLSVLFKFSFLQENSSSLLTCGPFLHFYCNYFIILFDNPNIWMLAWFQKYLWVL